MRQQVRTTITVEFDDKTLQADVEEALGDALKNLRPMLLLVPALTRPPASSFGHPAKRKDRESTRSPSSSPTTALRRSASPSPSPSPSAK